MSDDLACFFCTDAVADRMYAIDPQTKRCVKLFNPRLQSWSRHFAWSQSGTKVVGRTPTGRITTLVLRLNRDFLLRAREVWVRCRLHPPGDD